MAYRWEDTDHALRGQLAAGAPVGHVRYSDPLTGQDVMPTMRCEILRVPAGFITGPARQTGGRIGCVLHGDSEGRAYYDKKLAEGTTHREALRSLKRQISDAVYTRLRADARRAAAQVRDPGGQ
jgi:hypothetical protein